MILFLFELLLLHLFQMTGCVTKGLLNMVELWVINL